MAKKPNGPQPPNQQKPYFPKRSDVAKSRYLNQDDLQGKKELHLTVHSFSEEKMEMSGELKTAMHFAELSKPLILNTTNFDTCEEAWGGDTRGWIGHSVDLYFDPTITYGGKRVGGLRLRPPDAGEKAEIKPILRPGGTSGERFDDDIPFGKGV